MLEGSSKTQRYSIKYNVLVLCHIFSLHGTVKFQHTFTQLLGFYYVLKEGGEVLVQNKLLLLYPHVRIFRLLHFLVIIFTLYLTQQLLVYIEMLY